MLNQVTVLDVLFIKDSRLFPQGSFTLYVTPLGGGGSFVLLLSVMEETEGAGV